MAAAAAAATTTKKKKKQQQSRRGSVIDWSLIIIKHRNKTKVKFTLFAMARLSICPWPREICEPFMSIVVVVSSPLRH
jgi:hypothetical protein